MASAGLLVADFIISFMWVWSGVLIKIFVYKILELGHEPSGEVIKCALSIINMFFFGVLGKTTKGGAYNPLTVFAGAISGDFKRFLFDVGARIPAQKPQLSTTGFELASKASSSIDVQAPWIGRFWARTECTTDASGKFTCETADCVSGQVACNGNGAVPPASLVEIYIAADGGQDFYDVSLVDGFNLPVSVATQGGTGDCKSSTCSADVNAVCPAELQVKGSDGSVIACKSACLAFNEPQYCCTGDHGTQKTCAATNYSMIFENQCPQAYSYVYDDQNSTFTCSGPLNYVITFCPARQKRGAHAARITFTNNCPATIWPGTLTADQKPQLSITGFALDSKASTSIDVQAPWIGRFWARTGCTTDASGKFTCETADCGSGQVACNGNGAVPPASLVEINIAADGGQDFYDVSLVDGFNLPVSVATQGETGDCKSSTCSADVNAICPAELQVRGSDGSVIACKSACLAFNEPQYCCTGNHGTPKTCPATNYSMIFENQCPQAYSYVYDDQNNTFSCFGSSKYIITFCPA